MPPSYTKEKGSSRGKKLYAPDPKKFIFNVDTFWFTVDIENYDEVMDAWLRETLTDGRTAIADGEEAQGIEVKLEAYESPLLFEIGGGQKPVYAYQLRNNDFAIYFTKRKRTDNTYPIKVQINQFILWDKKVIGAYLEAIQVLMSLGFVCGNAKANRIDLCCHSDQYQWYLNDLIDSTFSYPKNIADDNKPDFKRLDPNTGIFETVYFGDRARMLTRFYNKSTEIVKKKKEYFKEIYKQKDMNPDRVWNIEFELHRDILKEFIHPVNGTPHYFDDINNMLSVEGLSYLWTWLTEHQFIHHSPFWKVLQEGDPEQFVTTGDFVIRAKDIDSSVDREFRQIRGRIKKFVLTSDIEEGDYMNEAIRRFYSMFHEVEEEEKLDFEKEIEQDRKKYHDKKINGLLNSAQKLMVEKNRQKKEAKQGIAPAKAPKENR